MNMKISLLCLSFCIAAATSMSIKDSTDEPSKDYQDSGDYNKMQSEHGLGMFNVTIEYEPAYDWRTKYKMSAVPNMGACNRSDWAFATVGMLEGYLYRSGSLENELSVQDLIDCAKFRGTGSNGCKGGYVENAFDYIQQFGLPTSNLYPLNEKVNNKCDETCPRNNGIPKGYNITTTKINPRDEGIMQYYISNKSPITARISCWNKFLNYTGGIFAEQCKTTKHISNDYMVLIVGYGEDENTSKKYWIVKNWMGEHWGENGYARVARDVCTYKVFDEVVAIENVERLF